MDSRGRLRAVLDEYAALGLSPVLGPELEFYLCEPDPADPRGYRPYAVQDSPVYTVGHVADPRGVLSRMLQATVDLGLGAVAAAHEYGRAQYEINLRHGPAMDSADRAFRFKSLVKELAARDGLLATFMGKPFNDDEGSGFHLHISLCDADGANVVRRSERRRRPGRRDAPLHGRPDRARAGDHGVLQPDRERLPAHQRRGTGADARELGPRPPHDAGPRAQGARVGHARRAAGGRRHGQPVPGLRRRAGRRPGRHPPRAASRRRRSRG